MMDVGKLLNKVNSLNEYIAVTEEASEKCKISVIQLNMSNVLALTKIRSLEIEHINKCEQNGIACIIFERMLTLPPSKTWEVLSRQMVNLLQYWLDAVRKHLVKHSVYWWTFLKLLLSFIKEIGHKDSSIPSILVEHTSECLLDLATADRPDAMQRYEILHCFNLYSGESSREVRFALKTNLDQYFIKLSAYMCNCGHLPTQYSIMETLLRWLVPRHDMTLRITSATKWFPAKMYAENVVDIFLERPWRNFFQDARDFLNTHNSRSDLITSVICRKLSIGNTVLISEKDYKDSWLDVNTTSKCISVLLDPKVLDEFGCDAYKSFETLIVTENSIHTAKLYKESQLLILSIQTISPPCVLPSQINLGVDVACDVTAVLTSHCDLKRLDAALRKFLDNKYQLLLDLEKESAPSTLKDKDVLNTNKSVKDANFSQPLELKRYKHSGYIARKLQPSSCKSPSTASTSSLAQLPQKLAGLPNYKFDKRRQSVCASPELSRVTELSETDDRSTTTPKKSFGVCYKKRTLYCDRKSQSDNESIKKISKYNKKLKGRRLSPVVNEDAPSCLLVATIGSADDSVINNTVERISKSTDFCADNIVELLVQEALNANLEKNCGGNKEENVQKDSENYDAIENTPNTEVNINLPKKSNSNVISSTSDESNAGAISDTPNVYINTCRKYKDCTKRIVDEKTLNLQAIEELFSQHITENRERIVISPTLAKKINKSSSETSGDTIDNNFVLIDNDLQNVEPVDFNNIEVIDCLNNIIDKVCDDFDKCTKYLDKEKNISAQSDSDFEDNIPLKAIVNTIQDIDSKNKLTNKKLAAPKKAVEIKLKYKNTIMKDKIKSHPIKRSKRLESKMSIIVEDNAELVEESNDNHKPLETEEHAVKHNNNNNDNTETITPLLRKKRKLFSPKDEQIQKDKIHMQSEENVTNTKINDVSKFKSTYKPYKDIEIERQRHIRLPRNRKSRIMGTVSPDSKKNNDLFDKVKESSNNELVTLAEKSTKIEVYNFSSDSEDDFKVRKTFSKNNNTTSLDSETTVLRSGKTVKRAYHSNKDACKTKRNVNRHKKTKEKITNTPVHELVDERMRETKEVLNTSLIAEQPEIAVSEPELLLHIAPEIEVIPENKDNIKESKKKIKGTKKSKAKSTNLDKKVMKTLNIKTDVNDDRTVSPLPGLVVEEAFTTNKDEGDLPAQMVEKFKKICQNPEKYINESNTTQNLLSDNERIVYSPHTIDITDELPLAEIGNKPQSISKLNIAKSKKNAKIKKVETKKAIKNLRIDDVLESEDISEQSIATVGITGHGDSEEAPPSPELIAKPLEHRGLHTEYMDHSTKDYFDKLRDEINNINIHNDSNKSNKSVTSNKSNIQTNKKNSSLISPVVSVERISLDDIRKWLPSSRNSESDNHSHISNDSKQNGGNVEKIKRSKSVVSIHGNKYEDDKQIHESNRSPLLPKKSPFKIQASDRGLDKYGSIKSSHSSVKSTVVKKKRRVQPLRKEKYTPKSLISPIKLFDDLIYNVDKLSQATTLSEDENFIAEITKTKSKIEKAKILTQSSTEQKSVTEINCIKPNKKLDQTISNKLLLKSIDSESSRSKISTSTKINNSKELKRRMEEDIDSRKKKKVEDKRNIGDFASGSEVTISSVNDWFKSNEPGVSRTGNSRLSLRDTVEGVMEKLDTTLVEIHQSTSNKFVQLSVSAQQQINELRKNQEKMYKGVAQDVLTAMIKLVDEEFTELDKRSQEQHVNFMKHLKEQISEVIRNDCKQKRIMVQLLKEDVEALLEYQRRNK